MHKLVIAEFLVLAGAYLLSGDHWKAMYFAGCAVTVTAALLM